MSFHDLAPWRRFGDHDVFAVRVPGEPLPMLAAIMGSAGQEFGVCFYRGPDALSILRRVTAGASPQETVPLTDLLSLSVQPQNDLAAEFVGILREVKFEGRLAPLFLAKPVGRRPRPPRGAELEILLSALAGITKAERAGLLRPTPMSGTGPAALWTVTVTGKANDPDVRAKYERFDTPEPVPAEVDLPDDLRALPSSSARWLLGVPCMPVGIENDERQVRAVLIVDEASEKIVQITPVFDADAGVAAPILFDAFRGTNALGWRGVPAHIAIADRALHTALAPGLAVIGVETAYAPSLPLVDAIVARFAKSAAPDPAEDDDTVMPADDDLEAWKRLDLRLSEHLAGRAMARGFGRETLARFFGADVRQSADWLREALSSAMEWFVFHHRTGRKRTVAEAALAEPELGAGLRLMLEARAAADLSCYRIAGMEPGEWVDLLDVLSGQTVRVHDRSMSQTAEVDLTFFARVYRAGSFRFALPMSQSLGLTHEGAMSWLEDQGLELTHAGLLRAPHLLGRLWAWLAAQSACPIRITNTDGEPLVAIRASYTMADSGAVRAALRRRDDIDEMEDDQLVWVRIGDADRVHLAGLQFVSDQLVAEVNSEARLERVDAWLTKLPGVHQAGVTRRAIGDVPVDDTLRRVGAPEPTMDAETLDAMRAMLHQQLLRWLDESIPALGGKTPRQAIATVEGRRKVVRLIRTMPDPRGPGGVIAGAVPRAEMLRELGLAETGEA